MLIDKFISPDDQSESMAKRYMNRFAIEEDNQFEIAAIQTVDHRYQNDKTNKLEKAIQTVDNLTKQQSKGLGYFHKILQREP